MADSLCPFQEVMHEKQLSRLEKECKELRERLQSEAAQNKTLQTKINEDKRRHAVTECKVSHNITGTLFKMLANHVQYMYAVLIKKTMWLFSNHKPKPCMQRKGLVICPLPICLWELHWLKNVLHPTLMTALDEHVPQCARFPSSNRCVL